MHACARLGAARRLPRAAALLPQPSCSLSLLLSRLAGASRAVACAAGDKKRIVFLGTPEVRRRGRIGGAGSRCWPPGRRRAPPPAAQS
jgi:hypothetical protein